MDDEFKLLTDFSRLIFWPFINALPIKFSNKQHIFVKIASFDIWIVSGAIFAGMLSERLLLPAILVSLLAGWVRWMATGSLTRRTFFDWPVILLILMLPVTCWVTAIPAITLPQVYRLLNGIALLYTLVNWITSIARLRLDDGNSRNGAASASSTQCQRSQKIAAPRRATVTRFNLRLFKISKSYRHYKPARIVLVWH